MVCGDKIRLPQPSDSLNRQDMHNKNKSLPLSMAEMSG